MKKIALLLLFLSPFVFAIDGDQNADNVVDLADFAVVSAAYDPNDPNTLAAAESVWTHWMDGVVMPAPTPPTAIAQDVNCIEGGDVIITLTATQGTYPITGYTITDEPNVGTLTHISGAQYRYAVGATDEVADSFYFAAIDDHNNVSDANVVNTAIILNTPPAAVAKSSACWAGETANITLSATDADGQSLTYSIVTGPTMGVFYKDGSGDANYIYFAYPDSNGVDTFTYRAFDGFDYSADANIVLTNSIRPLDCVNINSRASVVIPDGNTVLMDNSWMIAFWIKTKWPWGNVFSKRDTGGAGVEITVENGLGVARLYDVNELCYELIGDSRIDTGEWIFVSLTYESTGNYAMNLDPNYTADFFYQSNTEYQIEPGNTGYTVASDIIAKIPSDANFRNTSDLVFGGTDTMPFYGVFSSFSYYATAPASVGYYFVNMEGRGMNTVAGWSPAFTYRFPVNEGSGTAVKDTTEAITGTIADPNKIEWGSEITPVDASCESQKRLKTVDGFEMLPKFKKRRF